MRRRFLIFVSAMLAAAGPVAAQTGMGASVFQRAQIELRRLGYEPGRVDGRWTRGSMDALKHFQAAQGLAATGKLDRTTKAKLSETGKAAASAARGVTGPAEPVVPDAARNATSVSLFEQMPSPLKVEESILTPAGDRIEFRSDGAAESVPADGEVKAREVVEPVASGAPEPRAGFTELAWIAVPITAVPLLVGGGVAMRRRRRRRHAVEATGSPTTTFPPIKTKEVDIRSGPVSVAAQPENCEGITSTDGKGAASSSRSGMSSPEAIPAAVPVARVPAANGNLPADISVMMRPPKPSKRTVTTSTPVLDLPADISVLARAPAKGIAAGRSSSSFEPSADGAIIAVLQDRTTAAAQSFTSAPGKPQTEFSPGAALRARRALIEAQRAKEAATATPGRIQASVEPRSSFASHFSNRATPPVDPSRRARSHGDRVWFSAGQCVEVAGRELDGLVYVGRSLPRADEFGDENCLINPGLSVAKSRADTEGRLMGYWPAYGAIQPTCRLAYLNWLADGRRSPGIGIGYVFLFLYGLERRAILERVCEEHGSIRSELDRLLGIYGSHRGFHRYATSLIGAIDASAEATTTDLQPVFQPDGGEFPLAVSRGIGRRIADGRPIEADWMLAWTMSHPETRLRTPARRSFDQLRELFAGKFDAAHPGGLTVSPPKAQQRRPIYRAASGTFEVGIGGATEGLPDIWAPTEEIAAGRALLDLCTDELDGYSRLIGRRPDAAATLAAVSLLPSSLRTGAVAAMPKDDIGWFRWHVGSGGPVSFTQAYDRAFSASNEKATPAKLRDLGDVLGRFGIGLIPDPRFPHLSSASEELRLFELGDAFEGIEPASPGCRAAMLTTALAMLVAKSDGHVSSEERVLLLQIASQTEGVTVSERARLIADLDRLEDQRFDLASLKSKLAAIPLKERRAVGEVCVAIACGDGVRHANEVQLLERIYRDLGLDASELYASLAGGLPTQAETAPKEPSPVDELVAIDLGGAQTRSFSIGSPPGSVERTHGPGVNPAEPRSWVDVDRLASIRAETEAVGSVLAGVFDIETLPEPTQPLSILETALGGEDDGRFAGLDSKRGRLLEKLLERASWPRDEYNELARSFGLMPGGALEDLNDWAFAEFGDVVADDGETIDIHLELFDSATLQHA